MYQMWEEFLMSLHDMKLLVYVFSAIHYLILHYRNQSDIILWFEMYMKCFEFMYLSFNVASFWRGIQKTNDKKNINTDAFNDINSTNPNTLAHNFALSRRQLHILRARLLSLFWKIISLCPFIIITTIEITKCRESCTVVGDLHHKRGRERKR